jgi:GNAT superfamily N-acetyltransferase
MSEQKQNIEYRLALPEDAEKIVELVNSAYRGETSRQGWTTEADFLEGQRTDFAAISQILRSPGQWFMLAEKEGQLIASAHMEQISSELCFFGMFSVRPDLQGRGIGKQFLQEAENYVRSRWSCQVMEMSVITLRTELIQFYERRGYVFTGETQPFFYGNERFGIPLRDDLKLGIWRKRL